MIQCFVSYREHFGHKHPKYSDTLLDYGFYLLNVDNICQSVAIYQVSKSDCHQKRTCSLFDVLVFSRNQWGVFLKVLSFCTIPDSARHSAVCVWGEEHPRCHSP